MEDPHRRTYSPYLIPCHGTHAHPCSVRRSRGTATTANPNSCEAVFGRLIAEGVGREELYTAVSEQQVEIVLTAHPTQVGRVRRGAVQVEGRVGVEAYGTSYAVRGARGTRPRGGRGRGGVGVCAAAMAV